MSEPSMPVAINLGIDAEAVQKMVVGAIVASSIGQVLKEEIERFARDKYGVAELVKKAIHEEVVRAVTASLARNDGELNLRIREIVKGALTDDLVTKTACEFLDKVWSGRDRY